MSIIMVDFFYQGRYHSRPDEREIAAPSEKDDREVESPPGVGFPSQIKIFPVQVLRVLTCSLKDHGEIPGTGGEDIWCG